MSDPRPTAGRGDCGCTATYEYRGELDPTEEAVLEGLPEAEIQVLYCPVHARAPDLLAENKKLRAEAERLLTFVRWVKARARTAGRDRIERHAVLALSPQPKEPTP